MDDSERGLLMRIADETERIAPSGVEISGAAVVGFDAAEVLAALRALPDGAGAAAIAAAMEELARRSSERRGEG